MDRPFLCTGLSVVVSACMCHKVRECVFVGVSADARQAAHSRQTSTPTHECSSVMQFPVSAQYLSAAAFPTPTPDIHMPFIEWYLGTFFPRMIVSDDMGLMGPGRQAKRKGVSTTEVAVAAVREGLPQSQRSGRRLLAALWTFRLSRSRWSKWKVCARRFLDVPSAVTHELALR